MVVVIDPGHGGKDPGAVSNGVREKDVVLNIGLKLGRHIRETYPEVKVVFTRDRDIFVPLNERSNIANRNHADLFISLHANICGSPAIHGAETFVLGLHRSQENLDVAKKENSVILLEENYSTTYAGFDPNSSESYIMFELVQDKYLDQSLNFAADVQQQFRAKASRADRGVKQAGFLVLRESSMPSVLIEAGFISNSEEARYLSSESGQENLALSIMRAFSKYKDNLDAVPSARPAEPNRVAARNPEPAPTVKKDSAAEKQATTAQPEKKNENSPSLSKQAVSETSPASTSIQFRIQIAAGDKKLATTPANFKGLKEVTMKQFGKLYKYYYGNESSYNNILAMRKQIASKYPGSFIVAFENEEIIPVNDALKKLK
jgi:N-acetylmuramoyl-L-alanine amidase